MTFLSTVASPLKGCTIDAEPNVVSRRATDVSSKKQSDPPVIEKAVFSSYPRPNTDPGSNTLISSENRNHIVYF
jgi:hypothetical protein